MTTLPQLRVAPDPRRRKCWQIEVQEGACWRGVISGLSEHEAEEKIDEATRKRIARAA